MEILIDLIDELYLSLKYSLKDITILPGENLKESFYFAGGLTILSLLCELLSIPYFLDWKGGVFGTAILGILTFFGRRRTNALPRGGGDTDERTENNSGGNSSTDTEEESSRFTSDDGPSDEALGIRPEHKL